MAVNVTIYNPPKSGGSGVSSLNGEVGALTLIAGSNVTITPSGTNITIASTGGGGGSPGGTTGELQYNNAGSFGGDTATTDGAGNLAITSLTVGGPSNTVDGRVCSSIPINNANFLAKPSDASDGFFGFTFSLFDNGNYTSLIAHQTSGAIDYIEVEGYGQSPIARFLNGGGTLITDRISALPTDDHSSSLIVRGPILSEVATVNTFGMNFTTAATNGGFIGFTFTSANTDTAYVIAHQDGTSNNIDYISFAGTGAQPILNLLNGGGVLNAARGGALPTDDGTSSLQVLGTTRLESVLTMDGTASEGIINFVGTASDASSDPGGLSLFLGHNDNAGNRQLWLGDPTGIGNPGVNFFRYYFASGLPVIAGVNGDDTVSETIGINPSGGNVLIGTATDDAVSLLQVAGIITVNETSGNSIQIANTGNSIERGFLSQFDNNFNITQNIYELAGSPFYYANGPAQLLSLDSAGGLEGAVYPSDVSNSALSTPTGFFYLNPAGNFQVSNRLLVAGATDDTTTSLQVSTSASITNSSGIAYLAITGDLPGTNGAGVLLQNTNGADSSSCGFQFGNDSSANVGGLAVFSSGTATPPYIANEVYFYSVSGPLTFNSQTTQDIIFQTTDAGSDRLHIYNNGHVVVGGGADDTVNALQVGGSIATGTQFVAAGSAGITGTFNFDATTPGNVTSMDFVGGILTSWTTL